MGQRRFPVILAGGTALILFTTIPAFPAGFDDDAGAKLRGDGSIDDRRPRSASDFAPGIVKRRGDGSIDDHPGQDRREDDHSRRGGHGRDDRGLTTGDDDRRHRERDRERHRESDDRSRSEARMESRERDRGESRQEARLETRERSETRERAGHERERERERGDRGEDRR